MDVAWLGAAGAAAGVALVTAVATDGWKFLRDKVIRRFGNRTAPEPGRRELPPVSEYQIAGMVSVSPPTAQHPVRGRDEVVTKLLAEAAGSAQVLVAPGGWGKTTVATEVAAQARARGVDTWWITAADAGALSAGMHALALDLGGDPERISMAWSGEQGDAPDVVWALLEAHPRPWLLIFDNADDLRLLVPHEGSVARETGWLRRPRGAGGLLITTRDGDRAAWGPHFILRRLDALTTQAGAQLLLDRLGGADAGSGVQAADLADRLHNVPLMLHLAGGYLTRIQEHPQWPGEADHPRTFTAYKNALDEGTGLQLLFEDASQRHRQSDRITATWGLTLDLLADQGMADCKPVLRTLAHFADTPIPYAALLLPAAFVAEALQESMTTARLQAAIDALVDCGLVELLPVADRDDLVSYTARLHPLVAEVIRSAPDVDAERGTYLAVITRGLWAALEPRDDRAPEHWALYQLVLPHLHRACELATTLDPLPSGFGSRLVFAAAACVSFVQFAGFDDRIDPMFDDIRPIAGQLSPDDPALLDLRYCHAVIADNRGDFAASLAELDEVLDARRQILGPDDPATLQTRHYRAWVQASMGDLTGAEAEYRRLLHASIRVLGENDVNTLNTRSHLAWVLNRLGNLATAKEELLTALAGQQRILGDVHPHAMWTRNELANVAMKTGDLSRARAEYLAVLRDRSTVIGYRHRRTIETRADLAELAARSGDLDEAVVSYNEVLDDRRQLLGENHPYTLKTAHMLQQLIAQSR